MTFTWLLLLCAVLLGVGLLSWSVSSSLRVSGGSTPRLWSSLQIVRRRLETRLSAEMIRRDTAQLLRQLSALLQSGRGVGQAWGDLHGHWSRRAPDHPIVRLCAHAAAGDRAGRGAEEGLATFLRVQGDHPPRLLAELLAPPPSTQAFSTQPFAAPSHQLRVGGSPSRALHPSDSGTAAGVGEEQLMSAAACRELEGTVHRLTGVAALSSQTGAPLSRLVEQIAAAADDAAALHAQVRTAVAGPRVTQMILALLPLGGAAIGQLIGADAAAVLFGSVFGWFCLVAGVTLMGLGWWWSSRMIAQVVDRV